MVLYDGSGNDSHCDCGKAGVTIIKPVMRHLQAGMYVGFY